MPELSLILPTIDEVENLAVLLPQLRTLPALAPLLREVIVVDDGSTDGTRELVTAMGAQDPRVRLIARSAPPSLTASLSEGIAAARGALVGWMDADGTMPVEDLPRLVAAIEAGADLAVGSRFVEGGGLKGQVEPGLLGGLRSLLAMRETPDGWLGATLSWALNAWMLPPLLGRRGAHDWTSGFLVARRDAIAAIPLRGHHGEYFFDLWIRAERRGLSVVEVGCRMRPRAHGRSKTGAHLRDFLRRGTRYLAAASRLRSERD